MTSTVTTSAMDGDQSMPATSGLSGLSANTRDAICVPVTSTVTTSTMDGDQSMAAASGLDANTQDADCVPVTSTVTTSTMAGDQSMPATSGLDANTQDADCLITQIEISPLDNYDSYYMDVVIKSESTDDEHSSSYHEENSDLATTQAAPSSDNSLDSRTGESTKPVKPHYKYKCKRCLTTFDTIMTLQYHLFTHPAHKRLKFLECQQCNKLFTCEDKLKQHLELGHADKNKPVNDDDASQTTLPHKPSIEPQPKRRRVFSPVSKKDLHKCMKCGSCFKSYVDLAGHMTQHDKNVFFCCALCYQVFDIDTQLTSHIKSVHMCATKQDFFPCKKCNTIFNEKKSLAKHLKTHMPHVCEKCCVCYQFPANLELHLKTKKHALVVDILYLKAASSTAKHAKELSHQETKGIVSKITTCTLCNQVYANSEVLVRHITKDHPSKSIFDCYRCGNQYGDIHKLSAHLKNTSAVCKLPFRCERCGKTFSYIKNLELHASTHNAGDIEVPYKCGVCQMSYRKPYWLFSHQTKTHLRKKDYLCGTCGEEFVYSHLFVQHSRVCSTNKDSISTHQVGKSQIPEPTEIMPSNTLH